MKEKANLIANLTGVIYRQNLPNSTRRYDDKLRELVDVDLFRARYTTHINCLLFIYVNMVFLCIRTYRRRVWRVDDVLLKLWVAMVTESSGRR